MKSIALRCVIALILLISCVGSQPRANAADPDFSRVDALKAAEIDFQIAKEIVHNILTVCPPTECYYVGVGRSPTLLIAMLQTLAPESAMNFPFSAYRQAIGERILLDYMQRSDELELFKHFERRLPSEKVLRGRKILFLDTATYGDSLITLDMWLRKFLAERTKILPYEFYVFSLKGSVAQVKKRMADAQPHLKMHGFELPDGIPFAMHLGGETYDKAAEFTSYQAGHVSSDETPRPEYSSLKKRVAELLASDQCTQDLVAKPALE